MDDSGSREPVNDDAEPRDAVELEISDLARPRTPMHGASRLAWPRPQAWRSRRGRPLLAAGTALVLAVVVIAAARPALGGSVAALLAVPTPTVTPLPTPLPTATPLPTPSPYPTPTLSPLTMLGPAPRDCPPGPAPQPISPDLGPAIGGAPVWVYGNFSATGNPLTLHVYDSLPTAHTLYGWPTPLYPFMSVDSTKPVNLQVWNASTGAVLWFTIQERNGDSVNTVQLLLDPTQATGFNAASAGGYVNWFPILYVPAPGCYVMEASWPGGAWTIPFAAGA